MNHRKPLASLTARSAAIMGALAAYIIPPPPRLLPFPKRGGGVMSAARPAPLTLLAAALTVLALAGVLFTLYVQPAYAQDGSAPAKPTGLYATATHDQVILTWDDPGDDSITGYVILRRVRENDVGGKFSELVADTGTAATTYTDDTVAASTTHTYRIKAINEHGVSERSRWFHIDTQAAPVPDKPTGLFATATHDTVILTWDDPQDDSITGYVILRRVRVNDEGGDFSELVADTGSAATTYTDDSVAASTTYTYRIKAINEHGVSERSRWFHIDTPAAPEPVNSPAIGAPAISGTVQVGEELTARTSGIADEDGLENAAFSYQWLAEGSDISGATAKTYTLSNSDEGKAIKVKVSFTDDAGNDEELTSAATGAVAAAGPTEPPAQPTGLIATATHDSVMLTWNDPQDDSITGYVILRRNRDTDAEGHFDELVADTGSAATTYTDGSVAAETRYTYRIKAINQYGASERSRWYHIDTSAAPEPETDPADLAPSGLTAVLTDGQVVLAWDAPVEDAASVRGYEILRAEGEGEPTVLVADTSNAATTYTDATAAGTSYAYRVKAIRDGERSGASNEARVQLRPAIPTGLSTEAVAHNTVTLTWDDPHDDSVTGYAVVRWKLGYNSSGIVTIAPDTGTADTGYTDETVEPETEYIYNVKAINAQGESEKSEPLRVKTPEAPDPALLAPANTTVELVDGQVVLGWDAPVLDAASVTGYEVLRARGWDDPVTLVADTGHTATTHTDATADAPGESYAYRVKAIRDGERSQASDAAVVQLPGPEPSAPSGLIASFGSEGVSLVWQGPTEDAGTVTGYEVLRAQGGDALTTLAADTGHAATAYSDFSAGGTSESYAYRVRAIRGEERSGDSNEARVQLPPAAPKRVVSAASSDLVLLSWADPQDDSVTGYRILRRHWAADEPGEFSTLAEDTGSAETAYDDDTVATGRVYVYRVLAINPGGASEPSQDLRVRTAAPVAPLTGARAHVSTDLLSNLGQDTVSANFLYISANEAAQGFTTGSNDLGYSLRGVILDLVAAPGFPEDARVELWSATSDATPLPQARVAALTHATGTWATGKNTFNAPAGTTLKAGTTYFVFLSYSGSDSTSTTGFHLAITTATDADTGSAPGWSIGQRATRPRSPQGSWGTPNSTGLIQFGVLGSYVVNPDPPGQNVSEPPGGDCGSGATTQCRVAVGGSVRGNIADQGAGGGTDIDAFAVELLEGETYQFDLEGADTGQGTMMDPDLVIKDLSSMDLDVARDDNGGEGNNARVTFTPSKSETFYVVAQGARNRMTSQHDTGTYRLTVRNVRNVSVSEPDGEDCGAAADTNCLVALGGSATGNIGSTTDVDWFEVQLEGNHTYQIDVEGDDTGQGTLADPELITVWGYFLSAPDNYGQIGGTEDSDSGKGKNAKSTFIAPLAVGTLTFGSTFYIAVSGENDATGTYRIRVREVVGSGYGKTYPIDGRLTPGSELSGTLPVHDGYFGEPHYFALDGMEVGRYTVSFSTGAIDSIHTFWRRPDNPDLDDVWILTQAFGRSSYTFDVRAGREGTHYALLYIKEGAGGDFTATLEEAMPSLTVDGPAVRGNIPQITSDQSKAHHGFATYMLFYSVDLEDRKTYQVDVKGKDSGDGTMDHTMLGHIQAPDDSFVEDDDNLFAVGGGVGRNTRYVFTADQDGTYFLKVGGRIMTVSGTSRYRAGTFKVSIQEVP